MLRLSDNWRSPPMFFSRASGKDVARRLSRHLTQIAVRSKCVTGYDHVRSREVKGEDAARFHWC